MKYSRFMDIVDLYDELKNILGSENTIIKSMNDWMHRYDTTTITITNPCNNIDPEFCIDLDSKTKNSNYTYSYTGTNPNYDYSKITNPNFIVDHNQSTSTKDIKANNLPSTKFLTYEDYTSWMLWVITNNTPNPFKEYNGYAFHIRYDQIYIKFPNLISILISPVIRDSELLYSVNLDVRDEAMLTVDHNTLQEWIQCK